LNKFYLVNTRIRNVNLQSRARELLNKKEPKKSSHYDFEDTDINSTLNRTLLPDYDGVVYTLDAKLIGNIGRYFNHSCSPNIAVQNVFVDVSFASPILICSIDISRHMISIFHGLDFLQSKPFDPVQNYGEKKYSDSFFLMILFSWDYNYTVGEIAGRRMDCNCGSAECRRRVL
jgi:histone-lysine N-methyltransferase SETDB1